MLHKELTEQVIKAFYTVYNTLGYGFLEKVYEKSLMIELAEVGLSATSQYPIEVYYKQQHVGLYYADIVVNDILILEFKAAESLCEEHEYQLINYLKATDIEIGLLFNFGKSPQFSRKIYTNSR